MRYYFIISLCLCVCALVCAQYNDAFLALVGDKVITFYDVDQMTKYDVARLATQYSGTELKARTEALREQGLNTLIEHELVFREFQALKAAVPTEMLQERINAAVNNIAGGSQVKFEDYLHSKNMDMAKFKEQMAKNLAVELLTRDRISRGNIVSDAQVKEYYSREKEKMSTPRRFHIAVIQLGNEGKYKGRVQAVFQEIMNKLKNGTPFEELAKEYSEGANRENGGDQGWLPELHKNLMPLVNSLEAGQTAGQMAVIGSNNYIVKLLEINPGGIPELTPELTSLLREQLVKQEEVRRYKAFIQELYMKYPVRRMGSLER